MSAPAPGGLADIPALAREVADDAVRLAKAEIELAKAEAIAGVKRVAMGAGLLAGAGVFALLMIIFALAAVPTALAGHLLPGWAWWLVVALVFAIVALVLGLLGRSSLFRGIGEGKKLAGEVKEDVAWLKRLPKRNANGS